MEGTEVCFYLDYLFVTWLEFCVYVGMLVRRRVLRFT